MGIHPRKKAEVGRRLALNALAQTYGRTGFIPGGPEYEPMAMHGSALRLRFRRADAKWHWADTTVRGDTVVLTSARRSE